MLHLPGPVHSPAAHLQSLRAPNSPSCQIVLWYAPHPSIHLPEHLVQTLSASNYRLFLLPGKMLEPSVLSSTCVQSFVFTHHAREASVCQVSSSSLLASSLLVWNVFWWMKTQFKQVLEPQNPLYHCVLLNIMKTANQLWFTLLHLGSNNTHYLHWNCEGKTISCHGIQLNMQYSTIWHCVHVFSSLVWYSEHNERRVEWIFWLRSCQIT